MNRRLKTIALGISLVLCLIFLGDIRHFSIARENPSSSDRNPAIVSAIAHQLTVRLIGDYAAGSGVIIGHHGSTYQVLTCDHVIALDPRGVFQVLTSDGAAYSARKRDRFNFADLDLAVVEFTSDRTYPVATVSSDQNLSLMEPIYVAGFPNYQQKLDKLESTLELGIQPYFFSSGVVSLLLNQPLEQGYQIGITNEVYIGMSGGPVFNQKGEILGIIGRTQYAFGGVDAYRFADGSEPSPRLFEQMRSASWAIPIKKI
jgi:S1-C subfamily serine protease